MHGKDIEPPKDQRYPVDPNNGEGYGYPDAQKREWKPLKNLSKPKRAK